MNPYLKYALIAIVVIFAFLFIKKEASYYFGKGIDSTGQITPEHQTS